MRLDCSSFPSGPRTRQEIRPAKNDGQLMMLKGLFNICHLPVRQYVFMVQVYLSAVSEIVGGLLILSQCSTSNKESAASQGISQLNGVARQYKTYLH